MNTAILALAHVFRLSRFEFLGFRITAEQPLQQPQQGRHDEQQNYQSRYKHKNKAGVVCKVAKIKSMINPSKEQTAIRRGPEYLKISRNSRLF